MRGGSPEDKAALLAEIAAFKRLFPRGSISVGDALLVDIDPATHTLVLSHNVRPEGGFMLSFPELLPPLPR